MKNNSNKSNNSKIKLWFNLLNLLVLIFIVVGIPLYIWFFQRDLIQRFSSLDAVTEFLRANKAKGLLIYILVQIIQIVISIIPGQIFQVAAGYVYGFLTGLIASMMGAAIGTTITYFLAKWLGRGGMEAIFGKEKMTYYVKRLNSHRAYNIVFLLYLIPGIPKDLVGYAAGISRINFKIFLLLSLVGRAFGMIGSLLVGTMYEKKMYIAMLCVSVIFLFIFIICIIYRKKLISYIDSIYDKLGNKNKEE